MASTIAFLREQSSGWRPAHLLDALEARLEAERDQLPLWIPVGLGAGIAAWFALPTREDWIALLLAALGLALASFTFGGGRRTTRAIAIFALAIALGCGLVWLRAERVAVTPLDRPVISRFTAEIERIERLPARESIRLTLREPDDAQLPGRFRVNIDEVDEPAMLLPGARIALHARLTPPPEAAIPGAYDYAQRAWFDGIGATGRAWDMPIVVAPAPEGAGSWLGRIRARLTAHISARLPGSRGGVATAFVTGDRGGISEADAEAMRRSGLAHLLSISGLHVTAVVAATMLLVLKLLALSPRLALHAPLLLIAAGAAALAGVGYTLLSGAEVPTIRSCIAALLVLAGIALGRDAITLRLVATGAIVVLIFWPESVVGPSFQLSFAAVTAIVALHENPRVKALLSRRDESWPAKLGRFGLGLLITGVVVEFVLMPIALYHFHQAGLYGALANIAAIPLTTFVIMPLEALALFLDIFGIGEPVWWLAGQAIGLLLGIAHSVSAAPGAVARLPSMPGPAFVLIGLGGLWISLWRTRWRLAGVLPVLIGSGWALATPPPDILVNRDGRHMAIRSGDRLVVLRPRAGEYIRDVFNEGSGLESPTGAIDELPEAICGEDSCRALLRRRGREWRVFATRSRHYLPWPAMIAECAASDVVISSRRLPEDCRPRALKIDRATLERTGGVAITLGNQARLVTARTPGAEHPWLRSRTQEGAAEAAPILPSAGPNDARRQ